MPEMSIKVTQELDKLGEEFLDSREFEIVFNLSGKNKKYVICEIDGETDCYIKRDDLKMVLSALGI